MADIKLIVDTKSVDRAIDKIDRLRTGVGRTSTTTKKYTSTVEQASRANVRHSQSAKEVRNQYVRMNAATFKAQQSTKRFASVGLQQVGYQVGDFAVQLQGGTNAAVAFGQQFSQLAGIFGAWGAVAGAGVAITTAFIAPLLEAKEAAKGLAQEIKTLDETLRDYAKTQEAAAKGLTLDEFVAEEALEKAKSDLEEIQEAFSGFESGRMSTRSLLTALVPFADQLGLGPLDQIKDAEAAVVAAEERVANLRQMLNEKNQKSLQETLRLRRQELELAQVENQFGQDSVQYVEAKNQQEVKNLRLKLEQKAAVGGITDEERTLIEEIIAAKLQQQATRKELELSKGEAKGLAEALREASSAMSSLQSFGQGLERALEVARAKAVAIKNATSEAVAGQISGMRFDLEAKRQEAVAAGVDPVIAGAEAAISSATIDQLEKQRKENEAARKASRSSGGGSGGGGGGKSPAEIAQENLEKLREQLKVEQALIGKSEERKRIIKSLGIEFVNQNPQIVNGLETQIQQIDEMTQREQQLKSFGETIKNSLGDAFMSIVDGSKSAGDAFKDMARLILKQAFEMLVIQPILNSIFGALGGGGGFLSAMFSANGNAFEQGGKVTAYANGGVVTAPTGFQHSGGLGVMGEAGPEAIMPLKRGKNGKLGVQVEGGSQQPIVINQSFNFAANGDESVKRIIAQEAPKIANLTQKQILDQRRRGGTFKSTFG